MIASITELNLKNFWSYLVFVPHAIKSKIQASQSKGIISLKLSSDGILTQRTLTLWESEEAMRDYVKSGAHKKAMKALIPHTKKSFTAHFEVTERPTWEFSLDHLRKNGRVHYDKNS